MRIRTVFFSVCLTLASAVPSRAQGGRWLVPGATVRRAVTCEPVETGLAGDEIAVATFFTGGQTQGEGKDIRVFAMADRPEVVRHRVIMVGPGDRLRVAFATRKGVKAYHIYYGGKISTASPPELTIRRGLLYEVRSGAAAGAMKLKQVQDAFVRATPQGAAFVDNIFFGFNPFGPSENYLSHFTGYLNVKKPGEYRIATTSDDGSFVLIDGKPVVEWPGTHRAVADARHNAPVMLTRGLHRLDYWHAQGGGATVAEAAWRVPGQRRYVVIPKEAFTPAAIARPVAVSIKGQRIGPDFLATRAGESFYDNLYAIRMQFENLSFADQAKNVRYRWDFGDGQTATEKSPSHIYLRHGTFNVRLTVFWGPQKADVTNQVGVARNRWRQSMKKIESPWTYAPQVATYDYERLDAVSLDHAASLFARVRQQANLRKVLETLVYKAEGVPEQRMMTRGLELAELDRRAGRFREAVKVYRRIESQVPTPKQKARSAILAAGVLLHDLGQPAAAEREFRRVLKAYSRAPALVRRGAQIGLGDVACVRGDTKAAMAAYREAEKTSVGGLAARNPTLRLSSLARYIDEYIRTKDFASAEEFVRAWYIEFPSHRVLGDVVLMEARLRFAQERYEEVRRLSSQLVGVNRDSPHAPDLLMLASEAALKLNRKDDSRRALAQLVDDYPEYSRRKDAIALLDRLGGRLEDGPAP